MPKARYARGVDIVIYNLVVSRSHTIQVKSLYKRDLVLLGTITDHLTTSLHII